MNTVEHRFHVPSISCGHCVASITKALAALGAQVQADLASQQLRVGAPAAVTREQLAQALATAGYPVA